METFLALLALVFFGSFAGLAVLVVRDLAQMTLVLIGYIRVGGLAKKLVEGDGGPELTGGC